MKIHTSKFGLLCVLASLAGAQNTVKADDGPTVFGKVHMAVEKAGKDELIVNGGQPRGTEIGVRGSYDTPFSGIKSIYQLAIGLNTEATPTFFIRETWVGLSSKDFGTVNVGARGTHYKDTAKPVDPFLGTALEGRKAGTGPLGGRGAPVGVKRNTGLNVMSKMHAGTSDDGALQYHAIRYDFPTWLGVKMSAAYGLAEGEKNNYSFGADYREGPVFAFVDFASYGVMTNPDSGAAASAPDVAAVKIGGKITQGDAAVSFQYEFDGGAISAWNYKDNNGNTVWQDGKQNMFFVAATYSVGASTFAVTGGRASVTGATATVASKCRLDPVSGKATYSLTGTYECKNGNTALAVGIKHLLTKRTTVYTGFGLVLNDDDAAINNVESAGETAKLFTLGMVQLF